MKSLSGREFARIIERRGWTLLRASGSHHIYGKSGSVVRLSVPIHGNKPLKTGLLLHLAKLAEISDEDL
ncbi:type II toxin-antitoxin system HicA family toxin [Bradyrhizobium erythrophlei]|uniref:type II toxin-antitoxin system HicA family toxin n=1 Tax=Bradyrhizobium erythrophlei TaxID=1437360 RepID=UPI0035EA3920